MILLSHAELTLNRNRIPAKSVDFATGYESYRIPEMPGKL